ncbi:MAG: hypothetical protein CHACPFDD_00390 [Phycisphaerae bacterium]|nr:hypothetical protein [Phycisphaerae bacterium]
MLSDREAELIGVNPEELVAALREPLLFGGTDNIETELRHVYLGGAYLPFWTAVVVFTFTRGVGDLAGWIFTSAACSSAAVLMGALQGRGVPPRGAERAVGAAGCKDCGK